MIIQTRHHTQHAVTYTTWLAALYVHLLHKSNKYYPPVL